MNKHKRAQRARARRNKLLAAVVEDGKRIARQNEALRMDLRFTRSELQRIKDTTREVNLQPIVDRVVENLAVEACRILMDSDPRFRQAAMGQMRDLVHKGIQGRIHIQAASGSARVRVEPRYGAEGHLLQVMVKLPPMSLSQMVHRDVAEDMSRHGADPAKPQVLVRV